MGVSAISHPLSAGGAPARREWALSRPWRLWPALIARWTQRLDRQIEKDLRWLDHPGVLDDYRRASRG
jgi:hypothetical protein